jgi:outer membrane protein assembly factor BamB
MRRAQTILILAMLACPVAAAPWTTYRAGPQRTGSTDGKAGPAAAKVLWVLPSREHFIASPVPHGDRLFVSGLSFINTSAFYCLDTSVKAKKRVLWQKRSPELELPTVSSPAVADGKLIFGDGMHQTNGASLYCLDLASGTTQWRLDVKGTLVHLEGSPTLAGGKVYLGGGAAGVLCVDSSRLTLDGKEMPPAAIARLIQDRRAELQRKYEEAKKKGDMFAVPPTDRDLPKAAPRIAWQQGKDRWHVDAPVAVVDGKVLAASAFLDKEKVGERALFCLDARTGEQKWRAALAVNPWGGPSVQGKLVVVSGSSIGYDPAALKGAKGVLAAFDLDTGTQKWRKDLPGGAVSCAALGKDVVVVTCTDGRVRAYNLGTGALRWNYLGGNAFFAPAALSGDTVYAADLKGLVHAINLKSGAARWKLDLATDPAVKAPGMVYAGPVLHAGRLYVATCNLAAEGGEKTTAVVCIGDK